MGRTYNPSNLKAIGQTCAKRLPPASTVQAMFLYEMQREADVQARFEGILSDVARMGHEADQSASRMSSLEAQMKEVQMRSLSKDIEERLATSKARTDSLASRQNEHYVRLGDHSRRLHDLEGVKDVLAAVLNDVAEQKPHAECKQSDSNSRLADLSIKISTLESNISALQATTSTSEQESHTHHSTLLSALNDLRSDMTTLTSTLAAKDKEIGILFDERDALLTLLEEVKAKNHACQARVQKLEDCVRALTAQKSTATTASGNGEGSEGSSSSRSSSVHFCPLTTKGGEEMALVVPKGKGFLG